MGAKITIDSATLLNKGFEVIEAGWLYDAPLEKIHTIVQPESIIHSMVEFADGAVLAQMSCPSMELPIQLALTYPDRLDCGVKPLDFQALGTLHFLPLERRRFPCYDLALTAGGKGKKTIPAPSTGRGRSPCMPFCKAGSALRRSRKSSPPRFRRRRKCPRTATKRFQRRTRGRGRWRKDTSPAFPVPSESERQKVRGALNCRNHRNH